MEKAWREFLVGWRQARWTMYFVFWLFPLTLLAVASLSLLGKLDIGEHHTATTIVMCFVALVSLTLAGLQDGMECGVGRIVWLVIFHITLFNLMNRAARHLDETQTKAVRIAKHGFELSVTAHEAVAATDPYRLPVARQRTIKNKSPFLRTNLLYDERVSLLGM